MKTVKALNKGKKLRIIGFDDSPFNKTQDSKVQVAGIVCSDTRFEGMLWTEVEKDGRDATDTLIATVYQSKFYAQLHAVLLDGIAFGGFNIIDLQKLSTTLNLPCIAVMRKPPALNAIDLALQNFKDYEERQQLIIKAGEIYQEAVFVFQAAGVDPASALAILKQTTDTGNVPEALRIAHLIGSAIKTGESSNRA